MSTAQVESQGKDLATSQQCQNTPQQINSDRKQNIGSQNILNTQSQNSKPKPLNIFGKANEQKKSFNIFNQKQPDQQKQNIFAQKNKSVNLFSISTVAQTASNNIFKSGSKALVNSVADEDDKSSSSNASSSAVNKAQSDFKTCPQKLQMKFNYNNPWTVIKTYNLRKFKNGSNSSKQHIYMTFQRHSQHQEKIHLFVRAKQTKVLLFQGFGMKNITNNISTFMNKEENLKFTVIKQNKKENEEDNTTQFVKEELKIQFETIQNANDFKEFIEKEYGEKKEENTTPKEQICI